MSLTEYRRKRSFKKTPEPKGEEAGKGGGPLHFIVQKHDASRLHYDFRLELDGVLKSWAVPKGPSMNPADKRLAMMTEDHPLSYASFEGVIPKGQYGGGEVIVWDRGVYTSSETANREAGEKALKRGLHAGEIKFLLLGEKLKGLFVLIKMKGREENAWLLIKEKDEYVSTADVTKDTGSVLSKAKLSRDTTKRESASTPPRDPMPTRVKPMLARLIDAPFDRRGWLFERKWDGYRAIAELKGGNVKLYSRAGNSFTETYAPVASALKELTHDCVLDGEIVALKEGRADFHTLQQYKEVAAPLRYMVFDLLYLDGVDLRSAPLRERKKLLKKLVPESDVIAYSEDIAEAGTELFARVQKEGGEGIVAKNAASTYREGVRGDEWLKIKSVEEQEAIIVGFTAPRGTRKQFGALVLAVYQGGALRYIGHSGGGFTDKELKELHAKLGKIKTKESPLKEKVPVNSPVTWVTPAYVCEIKFSEWTPEGHMRHPIYVGLRPDKKPKEVVREVATPLKKVAGAAGGKAELTLTHQDKVWWPEEGYTKGDALAYYEMIAPTILPYLKDKPQNLNRHPNGLEGQHFYQKNITTAVPDFVETHKIWSESNNAYLNYIVCNNKETLLYLANLGCIELNPWSSRVGSLQNPDYMILDLDPHGRPWSDVIRVALEVKKVLDIACEEHYPKTSGKTGLHILVPLGARYSYTRVKEFAELLMRLVNATLPEITTLERNPKKRGDKMYLDFLQNRFGQTIAAPYAIRPHKGATVSAPLAWSEVREGLDPSRFTIKTMAKRLKTKGDLMQGVLGRGVDLADAIQCLAAHEGGKGK